MATGATRAELAALLQVTPGAVDGWRRRDCPQREDGRYDVGAVVAWRVQIAADEVLARVPADVDSDAALARWRVARAEREELRLAHDRGTLHDMATCEAQQVAQYLEVRATFQSMGNRLARRLAMQPAEVCDQVINEDLRETFEQLGRGVAEQCNGHATALPAAVAAPAPEEPAA
jgi:phage terminase Nu1 subunit (DNA packaging protein)